MNSAEKGLKRTESPTYPWVRLFVLVGPFRVDFKSKMLIFEFLYVNYKVFHPSGPFWVDFKSKLLTSKFFFYVEYRVRVCAWMRGTGLGASRRGSGLGRVGRVWACGSIFFFLTFLCIWLSVFEF